MTVNRTIRILACGVFVATLAGKSALAERFNTRTNLDPASQGAVTLVQAEALHSGIRSSLPGLAGSQVLVGTRQPGQVRPRVTPAPATGTTCSQTIATLAPTARPGPTQIIVSAPGPIVNYCGN
jgi:hypothetical protein